MSAVLLASGKILKESYRKRSSLYLKTSMTKRSFIKALLILFSFDFLYFVFH